MKQKDSQPYALSTLARSQEIRDYASAFAQAVMEGGIHRPEPGTTYALESSQRPGRYIPTGTAPNTLCNLIDVLDRALHEDGMHPGNVLGNLEAAFQSVSYADRVVRAGASPLNNAEKRQILEHTGGALPVMRQKIDSLKNRL